VELFHRANNVGDVLDDVDGAKLAERAIAEGKRKVVEIGNYIGAGVRVAVKTDRSWIFIDAAADVEHRKDARRRQRRNRRLNSGI